MFHATLIVGGDAIKRIQEAEKITGIKLAPAADVLIINPEPSIKIAQIRAIQKFLARKPLIQKVKICLLIEAQTLTLAAQNAFLKTLEEPPANSQIIMLAPTTAKLLPTVVSRCQLIALDDTRALPPKVLKQQEQIFDQVLAASPGERIALAQSFAAEAPAWCRQQLLWLSFDLNRDKLNLVRQLEKAIKQLDTNANPKLVLEQLLLSYPTGKNL